jgi:nucleoside-diphosphate-sugar epimerase
MKIIITGGRGFVGKAICEKFRNSTHQIHTIGRSSNFVKSDFPSNCVHHFLDLAKDPLPKSIFEKTDLVFHVAAKAGVWGKYNDFYSSNVIATQNLISCCKTYHIPKLIYTSTPSVVFSGQPIRNGNESLEYGNTGLSLYAETKKIAEKEILLTHHSTNIQTIALRPHLIWGENDPHLLPRVVKLHKKGKLRQVGNGKNMVDLTHVENVAHAHICAMEAMVKNPSLGGKAYFIGQSEPVELWKWLNQIFIKLNLPEISKKISFQNAFLLGGMMEKFWKFLYLKGEPPMTRFVASQLAHDHWFSNDMANQDLGYEPITSMNESLDNCIDWLRNL